MDQVEQIIQQEKAKIVSETAKITWKELERFYAQGVLILVDDSLDLVEVGFAISSDNSAQVSQWMSDGLLLRDFNDQAVAWEADNSELWSVVIRPWVLIQSSNRISK